MREKRDFSERSRTLASAEVLKKYFLVLEGSDTEAIYFKGVLDYREQIGINSLIELIPVVRSYSEEGWSNPKKIVDRMEQNLREAEEGSVSYETLLNWFMDYFSDEGIIRNNRTAAAYLWDTLKRACGECLQAELSDPVEDINFTCERIARYVETETEWNIIIDDITGFTNFWI